MQRISTASIATDSGAMARRTSAEHRATLSQTPHRRALICVLRNASSNKPSNFIIYNFFGVFCDGLAPIILLLMEDDLIMNKLPLPKYFDGH